MGDQTHAEAIAERYLNQEVEIFTDCSVGTQEYNDYEVEEKSCVSGIVRGAAGEMLILEVALSTPAKVNVGEMLINGWAIQGVIKKEYGISVLALFESGRRYPRKR